MAGTILLVMAWPLIIFPDLPLQDVPNHLARAFILLHPYDPVLLQNYRIVWSIIPDLGWDLWALVFAPIVGLIAAAKLLVATTFVLGLGGCLAMGRAITGRWSPAPLLAAPFLLNGAYAKGFLSFDLGLALSFWAIAWWAYTDETHWRIRLAVATAFATALYVIHFYAFALYGLFVLGFELQKILSENAERRLMRSGYLFRDGLQAAPAAILLILATHDTQSSAIQLVREPYVRFGNLSLLIDFGRPWVQAFVIIAYLALIAVALTKGWIARSHRTNVVLALCIIAFLVLPDGVINTTYIAWRVMLLFVFAGIASLEQTEKAPRNLLPMLGAVTLLLCAGVTALASPSWQQSAIEKDRFLSVIVPLPEGARVFFAHAGISEKEMVSAADGAYHVDAFAVITKRALVQPMFVYPGQQVLRYRDPAVQATPGNSETFLPTIQQKFSEAHMSFAAYLRHFDYVVLHGNDAAREARMFPVDRWLLVRRAADYRLYRLPH